ncbi:hypothetical protein C6496_16120 [Candidatus Poribacteria bacterium]|nr:MAG: hypothetical protein C6496_16120 [Candidatus Poribacteria bacterium]
MWIIGCGGDDSPVNTDSQPKSTMPATTPTPSTENQEIAVRPRLPKGIVFFAAEDFDAAKSTLEGGGTKWEVKDDPNALSGKYVIPIGANRLKERELVYHVPEVIDGGDNWKLWMRVIMPEVDGKPADSFFWALSLDGKRWTDEHEVINGIDVPDWNWSGWNMKKGPDDGDGNLFKIIEREEISIDVICLRSDREIPTDTEYEDYKKAIAGQ